MVNVAEARRLCPTLVVQHVATWKEGESQWAYHADADKAMSTHKVSLEPYRIRSREILAVIRETLPAGRCRIEKAGIDEVFIDLSACVHDVLVRERFPDLLADACTPTTHPDDARLPRPPPGLDWASTGSGVIHPDTGHRMEGGEEDSSGCDLRGEEDDDEDWDDVVMLEGARMVGAVRAAIYDRLRFRCSAGIASNKLLSKLGSSQHKPDRQTVVRSCAVASFLAGLPSVTRLRGLGGKLGARLTAAFDTQSIAELRSVPLDVFEQRFGGGSSNEIDVETAQHVYWMLRGVDRSEVTARTEIKSLISAKSFQPPLATVDQARRWLRVFVAEMRCRLLDERLSQALLDAATVGDSGSAGSADSADSAGSADRAGGAGSAGSAGGAGSDVTAGAADGHTGSSVDPPSASEDDTRNGGQQTTQGPMQTQTLAQKRTQTQALVMPDADIQAEGPEGPEGPERAEVQSDLRTDLRPDLRTVQTLQGETLHQHQQHRYGSRQPKLQPQVRLPQTIRLHFGSIGHWRSRQMRIPRDGAPLDEDKLLRLAHVLLDQARRLEPLLPCPHLAISLDGFEQAPATGSRSIAAFFQPRSGGGECSDAGEHEPFAPLENSENSDRGHDGRLAKRRRTGTPGGEVASTAPTVSTASTASISAASAAFACGRCHNVSFATAVQLQEHQDWHVARVLQAQERITLPPPPSREREEASTRTATSTSRASSRPRGMAPKRTAVPISSFFQKPRSREATSRDMQVTATATATATATTSTAATLAATPPFACSRCAAAFPDRGRLQVHEDWHFAKDLADG